MTAAKKAETDYLVSLDDRPHLVGMPEVVQGSGLSIVLPEEFLAVLRGDKEHL